MNPHTTPFVENQTKATIERYRLLFSALASNATTIVEASATGALTHTEALAVLRRHVRRFQVDLASLDGLCGHEVHS